MLKDKCYVSFLLILVSFCGILSSQRDTRSIIGLQRSIRGKLNSLLRFSSWLKHPEESFYLTAIFGIAMKLKCVLRAQEKKFFRCLRWLRMTMSQCNWLMAGWWKTGRPSSCVMATMTDDWLVIRQISGIMHLSLVSTSSADSTCHCERLNSHTQCSHLVHVISSMYKV